MRKMEKSDSKPKFGKSNHNENRPANKPLTLKKKGESSSGGGYNKNFNNDNRKPYGNKGSRPYSNPNRFNPNSSDSSYGERDNYGNERRSYNNGPRRENQGRGGRSSYNPNRFDKPRNNYQQQDNDRYDENNKKVVFRKRKKSLEEGQERKHFTPYHEEVDLTKPLRLNKFLANAGVCSRREADDYIQAGVISVNGEIVTELGTKILPTDKVMFHEQPVHSERKIYLILNKPKDFVTTVEDTHERKTVMDLVKNACSERIYPVGRLDRNTTGVLLFTNDGDLAARLTHPKYEKKKIYEVTLDKDFEEVDFDKVLNEGITLEDGVIKADALAYVREDNKTKVGIEIHSGKNRIVRRIFDSLGYKVKALDRVYFAGLTKKNLPRGRYRFLTGKEISMLKMGAYE